MDYLPDKPGDKQETVSPVNGTVVRASWTPSCGNGIDITDKDGNLHRLCHHYSFAVRRGDKVAEGQTIGRMGSTGLSNGVHVHWAVINRAGYTIDPERLLKSDDDVIVENFKNIWKRDPAKGEVLYFKVRMQKGSIKNLQDMRNKMKYWYSVVYPGGVYSKSGDAKWQRSKEKELL